jgi:hypothetical protein
MNLQCGLPPADRLHRLITNLPPGEPQKSKQHECINILESSP